jgi:5,10-methylene-tetrahydrofolate dehydrogenase/methenyl tetrahydrofolate cyclohydrolase
MAKTAKAETVRKLNAQMARIAAAIVGNDRKIEAYMERKATELETFGTQLDVILDIEAEGQAN